MNLMNRERRVSSKTDRIINCNLSVIGYENVKWETFRPLCTPYKVISSILQILIECTQIVRVWLLNLLPPFERIKINAKNYNNISFEYRFDIFKVAMNSWENYLSMERRTSDKGEKRKWKIKVRDRLCDIVIWKLDSIINSKCYIFQIGRSKVPSCEIEFQF